MNTINNIHPGIKTILVCLICLMSSNVWTQNFRLSTIAPELVFSASSTMLGIATADKMIEEEFQRQEVLYAGMGYYHSNDWEQAAIVLSKYVDTYLFPLAEFEAALFMKAKAAMNAGLFITALESFDHYLSQDIEDTELRSQAEFYRAVMMLNVNAQAGIAYLKAVSEDHMNHYQNEAECLYHCLNE